MVSNIARMSRIIFVVVAIFAAMFQWSILLERLIAAIWGWYKFQGYGGGGQITVAKSTQVMFYLFSSVLLLASVLLSRRTVDDVHEQWVVRAARFVSYSFAAGIVFWSLMLASPLVVWRAPH